MNPPGVLTHPPIDPITISLHRSKDPLSNKKKFVLRSCPWAELWVCEKCQKQAFSAIFEKFQNRSTTDTQGLGVFRSPQGHQIFFGSSLVTFETFEKKKVVEISSTPPGRAPGCHFALLTPREWGSNISARSWWHSNLREWPLLWSNFHDDIFDFDETRAF